VTRISDAALAHLQSVAFADGDRYSLIEPVGEGGMGVVYRAVDAELGREVAVKVLRAPTDAGLVARFRQEARVLARLPHPGIVPVHDAGVLADGRAFYVMMLVRGQPLDARARELHTLAERLRLFLRICEPVAFAHSQQVVHRDLKPANIMVGPFGEVLIMDWGVAKVLGVADHPVAASGREGVHTGHGTVLGTPGYMAPEQAAGAPAVDHRADQYALGAILTELLDGVEAPAAVRAVAAKAMAVAPDGRYASVMELSADLDRFLDGEPVQAYPESALERLARVVTRHRTAIILVMAYLLMRLVLLLFRGR
jgi:eukaryotic-like serine/threonine-protein kinase